MWRSEFRLSLPQPSSPLQLSVLAALTTVVHRIDEEKADWIIYITDMGQSSHFDLVRFWVCSCIQLLPLLLFLLLLLPSNRRFAVGAVRVPLVSVGPAC